MSSIIKLLEKVHGQADGDKPGLTSEEIAEQTGLGRSKVAQLLKKAAMDGKLEPVPWVDPQHWSGRPRQVICWKTK